MQMQTTLITGNTYPHREAIKRMGGRWDAAAKGWRVPTEQAEKAQALVAGAEARPAKTVAASRARKPAPRRPAYEPGPDEIAISRRSAGRSDPGYEPGQIVRIKDRYLVVTGGCRKYYDDDTGGSLADGWYCGAYARPATDAECTDRRAADGARKAKADAVEALWRAVEAMPVQSRGARLPEWTRNAREIERPSQFAGSLASRPLLYVAAAGCAYYAPVYDDDPIIRMAAAGTPEHAAVIAALAAAEG